MTARETMVPALARGTGTDQGILVGAREALACGAVILGPALAGGLVTLATSPVAALTVTATMSALAGAATLALPAWAGKTAGSAAPGSHSRLLADFREGVHHLFAEHRTLRALTLLSVGSLAAVAAIQGLVLPAYFAGIGRPGGAGLALSALAAGTMVGAAWPAASRGRVDARRAVLAGASMLVSGTWLLTALAGYASILTASVLIGAGTGTIAALTGTLSLTLARTDIQGRVLGNQNALTLGAAPVAALAVAGAIAAFDVRTGLAFVAVGLTGLAGWAALTPALGKRELAGDYATRRSGIVGDSGHHGGTRSPAMPGPTGR
jgi:hypothetical protein